MKKINSITWLIVVLMTLVCKSTFAASDVNYEVEVGKTLRLDISSFGVQCMANGSSYTWEITSSSDYLSFTGKYKNYAIVKGIKAGQLVGIQYTGYYYSNGIQKVFYDVFYVRVVSSGTPSTGPTSIEVFPTPQTLKIGEVSWVYAKQTGAIGGTYFYSENENIASVTRGELASPNSYTTAAQITAKKAGTVNIIAKNVNGLTAICKVTVTAPTVTSVSIKSAINMNIGETYTLIPTIYPSNAETTFSWVSDNNKVATVSQSGIVTAKSAGKANVKIITDNGKTATCLVTVNTPAPVEHVISYSIYGSEYGQIFNNGVKLVGEVVSYLGSFSVNEGDDIILTILPNDGCKIELLWLDSENVYNQLVDNKLTLHNVSKDMNLVVTFAKENIPDAVNEMYINDTKPAPIKYIKDGKIIIADKYNTAGQPIQ